MKRLYITNRVDLHDMGEPVGLIYKPYLGGLTHFDDENDDSWKAITSEDHVDGVFESMVVAVDTSEENHAILENDPDITRIDDL